MQTTNIVSSVAIKGCFSTEGGAIANFSVINSTEPNSDQSINEASSELSEFLLAAVPHAVLDSVIPVLLSRLEELDYNFELFDKLAAEAIYKRVDPKLNSYIVDKEAVFGDAVMSTKTLIGFLDQAIEYVSPTTHLYAE